MRERYVSRYPRFQFGEYKGVVLKQHAHTLPTEFFVYIDQMAERGLESHEMTVMANRAYEMMTGKYTVNDPLAGLEVVEGELVS